MTAAEKEGYVQEVFKGDSHRRGVAVIWSKGSTEGSTQRIDQKPT